MLAVIRCLTLSRSCALAVARFTQPLPLACLMMMAISSVTPASHHLSLCLATREVKLPGVKDGETTACSHPGKRSTSRLRSRVCERACVRNHRCCSRSPVGNPRQVLTADPRVFITCNLVVGYCII
jgi:hypothetical protein